MLMLDDKNMDVSDRKTQTRLALVEQSLNYFQTSLDKIELNIDQVNTKIDRVESKIDTSLKWILSQGVFVFFSAATLGFTIYQLFQHS